MIILEIIETSGGCRETECDVLRFSHLQFLVDAMSVLDDGVGRHLIAGRLDRLGVPPREGLEVAEDSTRPGPVEQRPQFLIRKTNTFLCKIAGIGEEYE